MVKIFRNYNTLAEYEADVNKPVNTLCFIKDAKVIYADGIQYSYKQLDYLPPATAETEALEYMGKIIKNAHELGLIGKLKPVPIIYWTGDSNTIDINGNIYTAEANKVNIDDVEYYQLKLDKDLDNNFYKFNKGKFVNLIFKDIDTSKVTIMDEMFSNNYYNLIFLNLSGFNTSNVTSMDSMFYNCYVLKSIDLSGFDTSNVTDMRYMFGNCYSLTSLNLSKFDTSNVNNMRSMFTNCQVLTSLDLSKFDTSNVTDMGMMFCYCEIIKSFDLSSWNVSSVTNMESMFYYCSALTSLDLSGWDISNVTTMNDMFYKCSALKTIRMIGCSQTTIDKIKAQLSTDGITSCTIVTE